MHLLRIPLVNILWLCWISSFYDRLPLVNIPLGKEPFPPLTIPKKNLSLFPFFSFLISLFKMIKGMARVACFPFLLVFWQKLKVIYTDLRIPDLLISYVRSRPYCSRAMLWVFSLHSLHLLPLRVDKLKFLRLPPRIANFACHII